jgi:hypothetical protein
MYHVPRTTVGYPVWVVLPGSHCQLPGIMGYPAEARKREEPEGHVSLSVTRHYWLPGFGVLEDDKAAQTKS